MHSHTGQIDRPTNLPADLQTDHNCPGTCCSCWNKQPAARQIWAGSISGRAKRGNQDYYCLGAEGPTAGAASPWSTRFAHFNFNSFTFMSLHLNTSYSYSNPRRTNRTFGGIAGRGLPKGPFKCIVGVWAH